MRVISRSFAVIGPQQRRWLLLGLITLVAVFAVWFFLLRDGGQGQSGGTTLPPRPALGKTIPYEAYRAAVKEAATQVRDAASLSGDERKKGVESAIRTLEKVEGALVAPQGTREGEGAAEIDNTYLLAELRASNANLARVERGLSVLGATLQGESNTLQGTLDGERSKVELRSVLNDSAFDYERDLSPLQRLARWIGSLTGQADSGGNLWRWFTTLIASIAAGTLAYLASDKLGNRWARLGIALAAGLLTGGLFYAGVEALGTTIQVIGAVGLVLAAVVAGLLVTGAHRASAPAGGTRRISELAAVLGMSAAEGRRRAEEAAGRGEYRSAIRYRCLALLLAFDEVGKLHFDRAATNREYLFRAPGDLQGELQPLLTRFDAVWYGGERTDAAEWQVYTAQASDIEARIGDAPTVGSRKQAKSAA